MPLVPRLLASEIHKANRSFSAIILTGPRRSGKTTLLKKLFPKASYYLMEDPDVIARVRSDPHGFLSEVRPPAILDEIQNIPEILNYVRSRIDQHPSKKGQWYLTGSQESVLMKGVTESMAGRAAVFQLLPFSQMESSKVSLFRGGFPEVISKPSVATIWFRSYLQTYLERDVRSISSIRDLATFRRFLALLASRCGQTLNKSNLAAPLGVSVPTIGEWLNILEMTSQIIIVPPYFENFGKRLIKSPKIYWVDSGLLCHLLGIDVPSVLERSPFLGPIFEGFVASEIIKNQFAAGRSKELYYFRDEQGLEVDFIIPRGNQKILLLEAKATATITSQMANSLARLSKSIPDRFETQCGIVYRPRSKQNISTVAPKIHALTLEELIKRTFLKSN